MKKIHAPHLNTHVVLGGRRRPVAQGPRLKLGDYLRYSLPDPPLACDYASRAKAALQKMYLNDKYGCCVIAGGYHVVGVETGNATGAPFLASDAEIEADYGAIGGFKPDDPSTDRGCEIATALNYWQEKGFANGTKLLGAVTVDATDKKLVQLGQYLFEDTIFGMELPDAWIAGDTTPTSDGFLWDVAGAPNPSNGHCVVGAGYDSKGITIATWALVGCLTYEAVAEYAAAKSNGELWIAVTPDQIAKAALKAPNGVDWRTLLQDFDDLFGGRVIVPPPPPPVPAPPPPAPPPTPGPTPSGAGPTLTQATSWIHDSFAHAAGVLTRGHAEQLARQALTNHWPR